VKEQGTEYALLIEKEPKGYSATFPDVPGCFTQGDTLMEVMENARDALEGHLAGLKALGKPIPKARHKVTSVLVQAPGKKVG
jgi:predicted RNase H-like HicB family nuclease